VALTDEEVEVEVEVAGELDEVAGLEEETLVVQPTKARHESKTKKLTFFLFIFFFSLF
jgi:uncharacterized metal-binding protein YceD (DUF177 family)